MSQAKLTTLQKKIYKFLKQKVNLLEGVETMRKPPSGRANSSLLKNLLKKSLFDERAWTSVFRCASTDFRHNSNSKTYQTFRCFWNLLFPRMLREERILKPFWLRIKNAGSFPELSRSINTPCCPEPEKESKAKPPLVTPGIDDGTLEQAFYVSNYPPKNRSTGRVHQQVQLPQKVYLKRKRDGARGDEPSPARRCRLSCPLPPPEYLPPEKAGYVPNYQSPNVKFAMLQSGLRPRENQTERIPGSDRAMTSAERRREEKRRTTIDSLNIPEFVDEKVKKRKKMRTKFQTSLDFAVPQMNALLFNPNDVTLQHDAVDVPAKIFKDEVLVQVSYSGVSGFDIFMIEGKVPCGHERIIPGREISGKVYAVGSEVHHVTPGDEVVVNAYSGCSVCRYCSMGLFSSCLNDGINNSIGVSKNGGWAEFVVVKKSQVHKIPETLASDQAVFVLLLSCILGAIKRLKLSYETKVLIQGLGVSGSLWASVLHSRGFRNVVVSDKCEKRKTQFKSLDLGYQFVPFEDIMQHATDVVVECSGSRINIEKSLQILNPNGQMCLFGRSRPDAEIRFIPYEIALREITIVGNAGNAFCFREAIDVAASLAPRYLNLEKLGAKVFPLEDFERAFQMKKIGRVSKVIFKPET